MKRKKIGNIFRVTSGGTPDRRNKEFYNKGAIPWIKTGDLKSKYVQEPLEKITEAGLKNSSAKLFPAKTVLIAMYGATIGNCSIMSFEASTNQACAAFLPNSEVNEEYLYYYLKSIQRKLVRSGQGGGQPNISATLLKGIEIPLPDDFKDQIRTATLLSCVETMITKRKESLRLQDEFLKSTFLEMFGDPIRNEKGWDKPKLKNNLGEISTGNTPPRSNVENYSNNYLEWIKTDNIDQNHMYLTPASEFLSETGAKKARIVTKGALLVACIAGSIESIGRAAIADRRVSFNQQINAIQPYSDINPLFLYWLFRISKAYIQSFAPRGMKKILTKGNFEKIAMIKPPKEIQDQFASIVEKAENLKTLYQQSLNEFEKLYGALSQNAFKGELNLSRIPIEKTSEPPTDTKDSEPEQLPLPLRLFDHKVMSDPAAREKLL